MATQHTHLHIMTNNPNKYKQILLYAFREVA